MAFQLLALRAMAGQDFEQFFRDLFGEPLNRLNHFQSDQLAKLTAKVQELAREATREELARLHVEINDLRTRVASLEAERVQTAADSVQSSF